MGPQCFKPGRLRKEAVLAVMRTDPSRVWTTPDVHDVVKRLGTLESVRDTLSLLRIRGLIATVERHTRGVETTYRLVAQDGAP